MVLLNYFETKTLDFEIMLLYTKKNNPLGGITQ